jgi:hypothetical protein
MYVCMYVCDDKRDMLLQANELIRHNMVVFSNGEQALQVLPAIVDSIPEARLNLVGRLVATLIVFLFAYSLADLANYCR